MNLSGKTALITGVNSGLGLKTMQVLVQHGMTVLGTARTNEKATNACASMGERAIPFELELADFSSVMECADAISDLTDSIDILICNAGVMGLQALEQVHGIEKQLAVNHFGHFILVNRLLDRVKQTGQGRILVLSSLAWQWANPEGIQFDNLSGKYGYNPLKFYGQSKLANALFSFELASRLQGSSVTTCAIHPGVVKTSLMRHIPRDKWWPFTESIDTAARNICTAAISQEFTNTSGVFITGGKIMRPYGHLADRKMAARLWDISVKIVGDYLV